MTASDLVRHGVQRAFNAASLGLMLAMLATLIIVAVDTNLDDLELAGRSSRTALNCDELMPKGSSTRTAAGAHEPGGPGCKADVSYALNVPPPRAEWHGALNENIASTVEWRSAKPMFGARLARATGARGPPLFA